MYFIKTSLFLPRNLGRELVILSMNKTKKRFFMLIQTWQKNVLKEAKCKNNTEAYHKTVNYSTGWRISDTQEPQCLCRTPRYRCCCLVMVEKETFLYCLKYQCVCEMSPEKQRRERVDGFWNEKATKVYISLLCGLMAVN